MANSCLPNGASSAAEAITLGGHVGTHIDALSHFSCDGKLHGGLEPVQSYSDGVTTHGVDTIEPIFRHAVLFDIARLEGVDVAAARFRRDAGTSRSVRRYRLRRAASR